MDSDDFQISDDECIEIYKNNILDSFTNSKEHYDLQGYNFHDIPVDIVIYFENEKDDDDNYYFFLNCFVYDNKELDNGFIIQHNINLFNKEFNGKDPEETIVNILKFLLHDFRKNYYYSKIIDEIIELENKTVAEKTRMARLKLVDNKNLEACCVCYELNILLTKCNHNVCRKCIIVICNKVSNSTCPLCRDNL